MKYLLPHVESLGGTITLLVLFAFFVGLVFWVYRGRGAAVYDHLQNLPLEED